MTKIERQAMFDAARDVLLKALPDAWAIYVYGSFARGDEWPTSDLDLGVLLPPGRGISNQLKLLAKVSGAVHRDVDIVDLRSAGLDLVHEVLRDGRPLSVRRKADALAWESEQMTDYSDFHPRRANLVDLYMRQPLRAPA